MGIMVYATILGAAPARVERVELDDGRKPGGHLVDKQSGTFTFSDVGCGTL